jgi:H+/Cl- antiporter ClcA
LAKFLLIAKRKILLLTLMLYSFRFYVSWIVAAVIMYIAFYFWHGIFLNDLNRISFSKALFLGLAALVYLVISFILYRTYESKFFDKYISHPMLRGVIAGFTIGFILFALVTVLGVSFSKDINITYILADCAWQIAEQVIGGIIIGLGKILIYEPIPELVHKH